MSPDIKPILVIKIGTNALLGKHEVPRMVFDVVAENIASLRRQYRIVLVTSGAIGFGVRALKLDIRPTEVSQLQALAMIGQTGLLRHWREAFGEVPIGQVLVTRHDLAAPDAAQTLRQSIEAVWEYGAIPIMNENDAVSYDEISFGDNDRLAAEIAVAIHASCLLLLTDQNGIQSGFGTKRQRRINIINITEMEEHIEPTTSHLGKGGFASKVVAATIALADEIDVYVGQIDEAYRLTDILTGKSGTRIVQ
ncbi:MAG: hypothetical protein ABIP74_01635 [Candidatus Saccharimonas sp.]